MTSYTKYGSVGCSIAVWAKATIIEGFDPAVWRRDCAGQKIKFSKLSSPTSKWAWNIDHIVPRTRGGSDDLDNLQPLNRRCNIRFSNTLSRDKPGYDKRSHFCCLLKDMKENASKKQKLHLNVGDVVRARQAPTPNAFWRVAVVVSANKVADQVIIKWTDAKYYDDLVYDDRLFEIV